MGFITTRDGINLHVKDSGVGPAVLLIHGWPLTGDMWEYQTLALQEAGYRVIAYDRRGFGQSSHPIGPYDYDTLAEDLATIINTLELSDVTLVGFSMGGGEVARYLSRHGSALVRSTVLISTVLPGLMRSSANPDGIDFELIAEMKSSIRKDRFHFLRQFMRTFYGVSTLFHPVSDAILDWSFLLAVMASPMATLECIEAWGTTDFTADMPAFAGVPTLVIHGTDDSCVPVEISSARAALLIPHARFTTYESAPHGLFASHHEQLNSDLLGFLGARS
ncbi:alpha/beta fold hydrolase [Brytella acorum]|uniref:Alpha/beta hydrolase n=1 Tax=Brytella acorum TaxID=2959299 RepID=A0AA35Y229_9PROT|nr:alpha/beta hydrolase [Brytella acorum]MDF3624249.1 alpha/beta hydrolase [Brytella acorum]CAI9121177.1 alpha/beta hydrolase [Brytella acorum]